MNKNRETTMFFTSTMLSMFIFIHFAVVQVETMFRAPVGPFQRLTHAFGRGNNGGNMGSNVVRGSGKEVAKRGEFNANIASEISRNAKHSKAFFNLPLSFQTNFSRANLLTKGLATRANGHFEFAQSAIRAFWQRVDKKIMRKVRTKVQEARKRVLLGLNEAGGVEKLINVPKQVVQRIGDIPIRQTINYVGATLSKAIFATSKSLQKLPPSARKALFALSLVCFLEI